MAHESLVMLAMGVLNDTYTISYITGYFELLFVKLVVNQSIWLSHFQMVKRKQFGTIVTNDYVQMYRDKQYIFLCGCKHCEEIYLLFISALFWYFDIPIFKIILCIKIFLKKCYTLFKKPII